MNKYFMKIKLHSVCHMFNLKKKKIKHCMCSFSRRVLSTCATTYNKRGGGMSVGTERETKMYCTVHLLLQTNVTFCWKYRMHHRLKSSNCIPIYCLNFSIILRRNESRNFIWSEHNETPQTPSKLISTQTHHCVTSDSEQ